MQGMSVVSVEIEVERDCSSETQQGMEFSHMLMRDEHEVTVSHMLMRDEHKVTELASMPLEPETDALFYDASDAFEVDNDLLTAVHGLSAVELAIAEVERLCSSESQQWESDCSGADLLVLQSFSEMLMPELDAHPGQVDTLGRHEETLPVRSYCARISRMGDWIALR